MDENVNKEPKEVHKKRRFRRFFIPSKEYKEKCRIRRIQRKKELCAFWWREPDDSRRTNKNIRYISISKKLRKENKTTEEFEILFNNLSFEEVIGLKLELASRNINGKMYNIPIWKSISEIVKEAIIKYIFSVAKGKNQVVNFLGVNENYYKKILYKYNIVNYFPSLQRIKKETTTDENE